MEPPKIEGMNVNSASLVLPRDALQRMTGFRPP